MRLIDADALKKEWGLGDKCEECPQNAWICQYEQDFTRMDTCQMLDDAPTVGGWISVKDRLPTYAEVKDDRVLVLTESGDIFSIGFDECIEGESIFGEWRQNFDPVTLGATDSDWISCDGVTHWMPLPEKPKEDDDAN